MHTPLILLLIGHNYKSYYIIYNYLGNISNIVIVTQWIKNIILYNVIDVL